ERAFGQVPGAVVGWSDWLNQIFAVAFMAVAFSEFVQRMGLLTALPTGAIGLGLIPACWLLNWVGTHASRLSPHIRSAPHGVGPRAIGGLCFAAPGPPAPGAPAISAHPVITIAGFAIGLRAVLNTYSGWNACAYFCEEVHAPERTLARATFTGIALVTGLYV